MFWWKLESICKAAKEFGVPNCRTTSCNFFVGVTYYVEASSRAMEDDGQPVRCRSYVWLTPGSTCRPCGCMPCAGTFPGSCRTVYQ